MESGSADGRCSTETNLFKNRLKAAGPPGSKIGECGQLYAGSPCVLIEVHSAVLDLISLLIPVVRESDLFMFCIYGEAGLAGGPHLSL